ncbi:MAG: mannitol dehydrogenase family protein [Lentilitoribacter sp.]
MTLLNRDFNAPTGAPSLNYQPEDHGIGIVHFGPGAFHRAHQAYYTNKVLSEFGGDWRILAVSLKSTKTVDDLNAQDGRYSLLIKSNDGENHLNVIGAIAHAEAAVRSTDHTFETLSSPNTHILSLTVTEKAYGVDRQSGQVDHTHSDIVHDLEKPDEPIGVIGMIVKGLSLRMKLGLLPYTVLCCDNLPNNGDLVRSGVLDFAKRVDDKLFEWISAHGCFPNTMVDRITPAATQNVLNSASGILGVQDKLAIETEPFSQWVIEDKFCGPRPQWENVGALIVDDVTPFEHMKLRMLNGAHSLIAYLGHIHECRYVRDGMANPYISELVRRHFSAASQTLAPLANVNFAEYADQLAERFENPNIAHETYQIAMDGTQKLPQRIFAPALDALNANQPLDSFALATAAWMQYCYVGITGSAANSVEPFSLRDPREDEIKKALFCAKANAHDIFARLIGLPDFLPEELLNSDVWQDLVIANLSHLLAGELDAIAANAGS